VRKISIIVAMSQNYVIGIKNKLPWHISADLKNFKKITLGHPVIMGRKTYDSIGKPLKDRDNIVISRDNSLKIDHVEVVDSLEKAVFKTADSPEVFIIGGQQIYQIALPLATHMYVTKVDGNFEGDAYFPDYIQEEWREVAREDLITENNLNFSFLKYERIT
jgi:dihydrofolate reductase|tara:strand:- start:15 stop:500 length:486 start_codon:yes stop_codon:yes gene_type:complete